MPDYSWSGPRIGSGVGADYIKYAQSQPPEPTRRVSEQPKEARECASCGAVYLVRPVSKARCCPECRKQQASTNLTPRRPVEGYRHGP